MLMVPRFAVTLTSITSELAGLCPGTAQGYRARSTRRWVFLTSGLRQDLGGAQVRWPDPPGNRASAGIPRWRLRQHAGRTESADSRPEGLPSRGGAG